MKGETPRATPTKLVFTDLSLCGFSDHPYSGPIIRRGDEITITKVDRTTNPAQVVIGGENRTLVLELANSSEKEFQKSFALVFTSQKTDFREEAIKTELGLIENYGFPIARCKNDGGFFYTIEFSPICGSFDGCVVQVSKNGLLIYGYV